MAERKTVYGLIETEPMLRAMELDREGLVAVVAYADASRALCNANDVRGFDLITMHDKAARGLRERYCGERWEKDEEDNQAGIRNKHLKIRVIPCNFDKNAGNPNPSVTPRNRHLKGAASRKKVSCNQTGWLPGLPMPEPAKDEYETWLLGMYADDDSRGCELSLPLDFRGGQFTKFVTRIILEPRDDEGLHGVRIVPGGEPPVEVVDIPIRRK